MPRWVPIAVAALLGALVGVYWGVTKSFEVIHPTGPVRS